MMIGTLNLCTAQIFIDERFPFIGRMGFKLFSLIVKNYPDAKLNPGLGEITLF